MAERSRASLFLLLMAIVLVGCAGRGPTEGLTPAPITDIKMVSGKWGGLVTGITPQQDDWVDMTIGPDGKYDFGMYRTIGVFGGSGTLTLADGKLQSRGDRGSATYTLYQGGGKRALDVQALLSDGRRVSAKLTPKD